MTPGIWTAMYAELPLHEAIEALYKCGWHAFEISTEHLVAIETAVEPDLLIERAYSILKELDLAAPQAHAYLQADVAALDPVIRGKDIGRLCRHIDIAARLKVLNVVVHPGGRGADGENEKRLITDLNIESFRRLGDYAGERGITICMENMNHPGAITPDELTRLLGLIDHPSIGITIDTSHAYLNGLNVAQVIRDYGPYITATHISDNNGSGDQHLTPGSGTIDWSAVMTAFREVGYNGLFNLEIPGERHSLRVLRELKTRFALEVAQCLISTPVFL